jgi:hypothetical protein
VLILIVLIKIFYMNIGFIFFLQNSCYTYVEIMEIALP